VVLLELVLALAVFAATGLFVLDGLQAALRGAELVDRQAEAADLSVTVFSHLELGLIDAVTAEPKAFETPGQTQWTWALTVEGVEDLPDLASLRRVGLLLEHTPTGFRHRETRWWWMRPQDGADSVAAQEGQADTSQAPAAGARP
jgi:hypothetical protein